MATMFTGIITHLGVVEERTESGLRIAAGKKLIKTLNKGNSIAVDGVCLTVVAIVNPTSFTVDIIPETWQRTMFGSLRKGNLVNLELPLAVNDRLEGHIIQGHIDGIGQIKDIRKAGNSKIVTVSVSRKISKFIVNKGYVAVNGVSLTIIEAKPSYFTFGIIPYTLRHTMFRVAKVQDLVNIEVDILAKYIEKLLKTEKA